MTVKELIAELKTMPSDLTVLMSSDAEGNSYGLLREVELSPMNDEGAPCHPDDADHSKGYCVFLWP